MNVVDKFSWLEVDFGVRNNNRLDFGDLESGEKKHKISATLV